MANPKYTSMLPKQMRQQVITVLSAGYATLPNEDELDMERPVVRRNNGYSGTLIKRSPRTSRA